MVAENRKNTDIPHTDARGGRFLAAIEATRQKSRREVQLLDVPCGSGTRRPPGHGATIAPRHPYRETVLLGWRQARSGNLHEDHRTTTRRSAGNGSVPRAQVVRAGAAGASAPLAALTGSSCRGTVRSPNREAPRESDADVGVHPRNTITVETP